MFSYTDDTAMMKSVGKSLLKQQGFDAKDMAKAFTLEYFKDSERGYGGAVTDVFKALVRLEYEEPFKPAQLQFNGSGSYGNGSAMRIGPLALFGHNLSQEALIKLAEGCSRITHAHAFGVNGAILQCLAVHHVAHLTASERTADFDARTFVDYLITSMEKIEMAANEGTPFTRQLKLIKNDMITRNSKADFTTDEIVELLGNDVSALHSVPTAIYLFIRSHKPLEDFETDNIFVRALYLAISLGGDTDTIATMACTLLGALYGETVIPPILIRRCESNEEILEIADQLYQYVTKKL